MLEAPIASLTISDGTVLDVPKSGTVVFAGPNNAGKSQALRDIHGLLTSTGPDTARVVTAIEVNKVAAPDDLPDWLEDKCDSHFAGGSLRYSRFGQGGIPRNQATTLWQQGPPFQALGNMLAFYAAAGQRLEAAEPASSIDIPNETPKHPLHHLYLDKTLEDRVSSVAEKAFGQSLTLNRFAGSKLRLHVGKVDVDPTIGGPEFGTYIQQVNGLPTLESQGDGMKSFVGLLLNLAVVEFPYVLVDEPEAFLHPPQARLLGRMVQEFKAPESQVFLATHNSNIVRGLLEAEDQDITIVRVTRHGDTNPTETLAPSVVKDLWSDPLLRYSEVLDGLFHESVVLCESDADCRFYASILDVLAGELGEVKKPELLFTHCGGYPRMPTVIEALTAVGVPVRVIADLDLLQHETCLRQIVEGLGGDWDSVAPDIGTLRGQVNNLNSYPSLSTAQQDVERAFERVTGANTARVTRELEREVRTAVSGKSGWGQLKKAGRAAIPHGQAQQAFEGLDSTLRGLGVFLVPVGELEGFVRTVGGHGPEWVREVHARGIHETPEVDDAKKFMKDVVDVTEG